MKKSSSGQMWIYREFRRVETEREAVGEWTSEGGFERVNSQVEADGTPPVIHRGTQEMSIWVVSQKYITLLSHVYGAKAFSITFLQTVGSGKAGCYICHLN